MRRSIIQSASYLRRRGHCNTFLMGSLSRTIVLLVLTISEAVLSTPIHQLQSGRRIKQAPQVRWESDSSSSESDESTERAAGFDRGLDDFYKSYKVDYTGAQVWKVFTEKAGWRVISDLEHKNNISIWNTNSTSVDVLIPAHETQNVKNALKIANLPFDIIIQDLQKLINLENPPFDENEKKLLKSRGHNMDWKRYHRVDDIHGFLDYLAKTYPAVASVRSIGKSYEGRDLKIIKISNGNPTNKAVFIDGGIHAREWISPATVTYFINQFAENFTAEDDNIKNIDWYFLPVLNPDGYEYTHTKNRFWRKNRRPGKQCDGVDLNRNFGYKWGGVGASNMPCSETYRGDKAFSEPESRAVLDFFQSSAVNFSAYLTYHSYGQYILYPWGYDNVLPLDFADLDAAGKKMASAIWLTGQDNYRVGTPANLLTPAAGGSDDWAKSFGVKYSYTIELNDQGVYGFVLPPEYIEAVAKNNLAGLRAFVAAIHTA